MNKTYRTVFNAATGTWAAASELAKGRRKSSKSAVAVAVAALLALPAGAAFAADDAEEDDTIEPKTVVLADAGAARNMGVMSSGATIMAGPGDYSIGGGVIDANVAGGNNTAIGANSHITRANGSGASYGDVANSTAIGGATVNNGGGATVIDGTIGIGSGAVAYGNGTIAIGRGATNNNNNAIAIGAGTNSGGGGGTIAFGTNASTTASGAVAVGNNSRTTGGNSASVGANTGTSRANAFSVGNDLTTNADGSARTTFTRQIVNVAAGTADTDAVNVGQMNARLATKVDDTYVKINSSAPAASATGANAVAIGQSTTSAGSSSVAVGSGTSAVGQGSVAIGRAASNGINSGTGTAYNQQIAIGDSASTSATNATAIGYRASATADNAIALGSNSQASEANTVSVGNTNVGGQRRIVNLAAGTADTDAVNVGQMNARLATKVDDTYVKIDPTSGTTAAQAAASAMAVGANAQGTAVFSTALGNNTSVTGANGTAVGFNAQVAGSAGVAVGSAASASGYHGVAMGTGAKATHRESVALGTSSETDRDNSVSVGNGTLQRQITNMAAGTAPTDAVNVSQLSPVVAALGGNARINADGSVTGPSYTLANGGTQTTVGDALSELDGALTSTNGRVGNLETQLGSGTIGLVQQAGVGQKLTVGKDTDGAEVDFTGTAGTRKLTGVSTGAVAAGSTDAINGSQLYAVSSSVADAIGGGSSVKADGSISAPSFTVGDGSGGTKVVNNVGDAVDNLNTRVTGNETAIGDIRNELGSGTVGLVQQDATSRTLTVGKGTDGADVDFRNNTGATRKLTGVTAGSVAAGSTEAINGSQLYAASSSVADAIGGGSTVNADGSITAPSFTVGNGAGGTVVVRSVGDAVSNLDGRVTNNETAIGDIRNELGSGTVGLVQQDATSRTLTVGKETDGADVDFRNNAGATRKLTGVTAGAVASGSTEAINGSQLYAASSSVADAIGGGSTVNADGSITAPSFTVGNGAGGTVVVRNVGDVVSNLDGRVTNNESAIGDIRSELGSGALGLVQQATPTGTVTVAASTGGSTVNFAGTDGVRVLSGIGAGIGNNDAVSVGQLKSVIGYNIVDPLDPLMAVRYDDASMSSVTFGGDPLFGTVLNNVGPGLIAAGSMQAVNGGQLFDMQAKYDGLIGALDGRVGAIESGIADGSIGGPGTGTPEGSVPSPGKGDGSTAVGAGSAADGKNSSAIGNGAVAAGNNGTAVGQGSSASAEGSTAIGQGASSSHAGSVAIGQGSTTSRENEVSFGSPGNERILGNVADGVRDTDAVNVRQLNSAIGGLNNKIDSNHRDAMGGVAAAMAVAGLPQSSLPGKTFMAVSGSTYGGEQGTALGMSYMSTNGKWVVKGAVNTSTRGEVGAVVGGGFYW